MNYSSPFSGYSGINKDFLNVNPQSSYQLWTGYYGADPFKNQSFYNYGNNMYDFYEKDYYNTAAKDPGLGWTDYLDKLGGTGKGLGDMWSGLSPSARGEKQAAPVRWGSGPFGQMR